MTTISEVISEASRTLSCSSELDLENIENRYSYTSSQNNATNWDSQDDSQDSEVTLKVHSAMEIDNDNNGCVRIDNA